MCLEVGLELGGDNGHDDEDEDEEEDDDDDDDDHVSDDDDDADHHHHHHHHPVTDLSLSSVALKMSSCALRSASNLAAACSARWRHSNASSDR
jgi:ABC-type Zn2+ transport system substrate-binding protein/surface adhesin